MIRQFKNVPPNPLTGAAAGRSPAFIEMMQGGVGRRSGSARLWDRYAAQ